MLESLMNEVLLIAGMTLVTFGVRYPVLAFLSKIPLLQRFLGALKYVAPAVLTAIIVPAVLLPDGTIEVQLNNARLYAGLIAALIAWRSKNLMATIVLGMLVLWGWGLVFQ
jgi:branched-subunit amino acid transport protein